MRKVFFIMAMLLLAVAVFAPRRAEAAATQNIVINVSINAVASLTASPGSIDLLGSAFSTQYATGPIVLTNDGTVNQTFKIQGANSSTTNWTMAGAPGSNTFSVYGLIGNIAAAAPVARDFGAEDVLNNATYVLAAGTTDLGNAGWSATYGVNVPPAGQRRLYLRFDTPTGGYASAANIGTITLVVSADVL